MKTFGVMRTPNTPALLIFHSILLGADVAVWLAALLSSSSCLQLC
jgi:hypothetical protein